MKQVKVAISDTCRSKVAGYCTFPDITTLHLMFVGWDSAVGIATRYGLDGTGIKSRWGLDFPHPSRLTQGLPSLLYSGSKTAEAWR
jgi:hypothetical protein